jgi:hypothetical protein
MKDKTNDELAYPRALAKWRRRCGDSAATYDPPCPELSTVDACGNVTLRNERGVLAWVRVPPPVAIPCASPDVQTGLKLAAQAAAYNSVVAGVTEGSNGQLHCPSP